MPTTITVRPDLPAAVILVRHSDRDGALIILNPAAPAERLLGLAEVLCTPAELQAVTEYLAD